MVARIRKDR
uniref:Uncharacterized protein n=1 Tax=Arundo donax TaxID=35708 RepID=A0A0A8Z692_ARUDO